MSDFPLQNGPVTYQRVNGPFIGTTAPLYPFLGMLWSDTTTNPATLRVYNGNGWINPLAAADYSRISQTAPGWTVTTTGASASAGTITPGTPIPISSAFELFIWWKTVTIYTAGAGTCKSRIGLGLNGVTVNDPSLIASAEHSIGQIAASGNNNTVTLFGMCRVYVPRRDIAAAMDVSGRYGMADPMGNGYSGVNTPTNIGRTAVVPKAAISNIEIMGRNDRAGTCTTSTLTILDLQLFQWNKG